MSATQRQLRKCCSWLLSSMRTRLKWVWVGRLWLRCSTMCSKYCWESIKLHQTLWPYSQSFSGTTTCPPTAITTKPSSASLSLSKLSSSSNLSPWPTTLPKVHSTSLPKVLHFSFSDSSRRRQSPWNRGLRSDLGWDFFNFSQHQPWYDSSRIAISCQEHCEASSGIARYSDWV